MRWISLFTLALAAGSAFAWKNDAEPTHPVLVELFTSEGCSSCPPADALLEKLESPDVIVLSEHVDYWDHIGWRDPYSSAKFSERQSRYADRFRIPSIYTPEMVVDGLAEFVGSDARLAKARIEAAAKQTKIPVVLTQAGPGRIRVEVEGGRGDVMIALASNEASTNVRSGENGGRRLHHVAVVRSLTTLGELHEGQRFSRELPAGDGERVVAWVQERGQGRVLGVAVLKIALKSAR